MYARNLLLLQNFFLGIYQIFTAIKSIRNAAIKKTFDDQIIWSHLPGGKNPFTNESTPGHSLCLLALFHEQHLPSPPYIHFLGLFLNEWFLHASSGGSKEVHPPWLTTRSQFISHKRLFTLSVECLQKVFKTSILGNLNRTSVRCYPVN